VLTNFNNFSLLQPEMITAHIWNKIRHLTLTVFPHNLTKIVQLCLHFFYIFTIKYKVSEQDSYRDLINYFISLN